MKNMYKFLFFVFLVLALTVAGCNRPEQPDSKNTSLSLSEVIEKEIRNSRALIPYDGFSYDQINVTRDGLAIEVRAYSAELDGVDIYRFVYDNGTLILKAYCLEALPSSLKDRAICIAMGDEKVRNSSPDGDVTVRRILPHTASKFYQPKELFSVTWHGEKVISALVDVEEEKVVSVWSSQSG